MAHRDILLAILAAFIWGATFPISAVALDQTPPLFFTALRFSLAAAFVVFLPRPVIPWGKLVALGILLGAGQFGLMFVAIAHGMPAGIAAVLVHSQAVFAILIAILFFAEPLTRKTSLVLVFALIGLSCLFLEQVRGGRVAVYLLMLCAALSAAVGNILLKTVGNANINSVVVWMSLVPVVPLIAMSFWLEGRGSLTLLASTVSWTTVAAVVYSAVLATVFAYTIWGRLLVTYAVNQVAPFFLLVPVIGLALSAWLLGERFSILQLTGSAIIIIGLFLALSSQKPLTRKPKK